MRTRVTERGARPVVLLALALGCGAHPAPAPRVHRVTIRAMAFEPAVLEARVGDEIEWINEDLVPHTATAAGAFDSAIIAPTQRWRTHATRLGELRYACTLHPMMTGTLRIR